MSQSATVDDGKITCQVDNARCHIIQKHLAENCPGWDIERYKAEFPHAPLLSEKAKKIIADKRAKNQSAAPVTANLMTGKSETVKKKFAEVFDLAGIEVKNGRGDDLMVDVYSDIDERAAAMIPDVDDNYVFDIELTKTVIMAFALNMPLYAYGFHGTGKTTLLEQICARTNRPFMRAQHTIGTEEAHIVGQYVVKDGATVFQPGPLTIAMIEGHVYCADEYDFAMPSVVSVYQPVLEGKALVIKDAPPEFRVVRPHKNFRFVATGNTNGVGDETGLYQGTQMQNAANYSRFGICMQIGYMEPKVEIAVVMRQTGVDRPAAEKIVQFANEVREAFKAGRLGATISPRELINAGKIGRVKSGKWADGLQLACVNRMSRVDGEVVRQYLQRIFG